MADAASSESTGSKAGAAVSKYYPYVFIIIGFLVQFVTVVLLGINAGSP